MTHLAEVEKQLAELLLNTNLSFNVQERTYLHDQFLPPDIHDAIMRHDEHMALHDMS